MQRLVRYLIGREQAAARLEELVRERTRQFQEANNQLIAAQDPLEMAPEALERDRRFADSLLEQAGFELAVPP
jgi:nitrogen fixation/metabolism regulation signal transduction histidine kinase